MCLNCGESKTACCAAAAVATSPAHRICWIFPSPSLSLSLLHFFFFLSTAFVAFQALSNFLCACLFFFFFFFPRMPDVASTSPILFSTVVSRRLARCSQQLPQHVICLILQSQLRVFSLFYAWRLCVCLLSRGRVVVTQEGNFVQK